MTLAELRRQQDLRRARVTLQDLNETMQAFLAGAPAVEEVAGARRLCRVFLALHEEPPRSTPPAAPAALAPTEIELTTGPPTHPQEGVSHGS